MNRGKARKTKSLFETKLKEKEKLRQGELTLRLMEAQLYTLGILRVRGYASDMSEFLTKFREFIFKEKWTIEDLERGVTSLQSLNLLSYRQGKTIKFKTGSECYGLYPEDRKLTNALLNLIKARGGWQTLLTLHRAWEEMDVDAA